MTVKDDQGTKKITLSKALGSRVKMLNIVYFVFFSIGVLRLAIMLNMADADFSSTRLAIGLTALVIVGLVYLFAGYKFLNKAFESETVTISPNSITISKGGFAKKTNVYDIHLISNFRHVDKPALTSHPLAGQSFDYLGFQTQQQAINELHGDNRLVFNYKGNTIKFGENVYTWEFEELVDMLNDAAGRNVTAPSVEEENAY